MNRIDQICKESQTQLPGMTEVFPVLPSSNLNVVDEKNTNKKKKVSFTDFSSFSFPESPTKKQNFVPEVNYSGCFCGVRFFKKSSHKKEMSR